MFKVYWKIGAGTLFLPYPLSRTNEGRQGLARDARPQQRMVVRLVTSSVSGMPPPLSEEKVAEIIEMLKDKARSNADIGRTAEINPVTVARLKRKFDEEVNGHFYIGRLEHVSAAELLKIAQDPLYDPAPTTTKVLNDKEIPEISREIMAKHRIDFTKGSKRFLQEKFDGDSSDFHGFWVYPRDAMYDKPAVDNLIEQMEQDPATMDKFTEIFEYTQEVEATAEQKRSGENLSKDDLRMGDGKRRHLVWDVWLEEVHDRLKKSEASVTRYQKELKEAQARLDAYSAAAESNLARSTRGTENTIAKHASTAASEGGKVTDAQKSLVAAEQAYAAAKEFRTRTEKVQTVLCENYRRIIRHTPYGRQGVECSVNERSLLSIILSLPEAGSQTMHGDSLQQGCSLLMSARKRQYLIILLNGFRAMRSMDRMLLRRLQALEYVRGRIAAETSGNLRFWNDKAQNRIWNYLCCLQFQHEKIGGIQAVRVPIEEGETLVVDNRTLHGGSRGEATPGFRFHAYGYDRDIQKRGVEGFHKDQEVTIDPLDVRAGFFPVCRWAQCGPGKPVFLS